ncbi:MAG: hypothetical protein GYB31_00465 [Bacteroidetes bacterium]|nr:hypothetical protein [Bacteroidota bacterium]
MERLKDHLDQLHQTAKIHANVSSLLSYLPNCEYELILWMQHSGKWNNDPSKPAPTPPAGFKPGDGSVDFGLFLYWIHNKELIDTSEFNKTEKALLNALLDFLNKFVLPASQMTKTNYQFFADGNELIYKDGSVLGMEKWATYDQGWFMAFLNLIKTVSIDNWYYGSDFPAIKETQPVQITGSDKNKNIVHIAVLGDWGTGDETAKSLMSALTGYMPDYIIHLGDVYYSGTPETSILHPGQDIYFHLGEEKNNLMDIWPANYQENGKSITLNSNHEMYSGANGYFYNALGHDRLFGWGIFDIQKGESCLALQFGDWTVLCLDSAYMSKVSNAFMEGSIGGADGTQGTWIKSLGLDPCKTIVMTHHNGFADDCSEMSPLWAEINGALGDDPFAWYWGHVHNGIVYSSPITIPDSPKAPGKTTKTYARCSGHASIPYGNSEVLEKLDGKQITWRETNKQKDSQELCHGFAIISITKDDTGTVQKIEEHFFDTSGQQQPVYSKQIF